MPHPSALCARLSAALRAMFLAWLFASATGFVAVAQDDPAAAASAAVDHARVALEQARAAPVPVSPDAEPWAQALQAADAAVVAAGDGPLALAAARAQAEAYHAVRWWSRAATAWERVVQLQAEEEGPEAADPEDVAVARARWREAAFQVAYARYRAGDLTGAETRFLQLLERHPDDVEPLRWAARAALEDGRPEVAAQRFETLLEARPGDESAAWHLQLARERITYGRDASDAFRRGIRAADADDLEAAEQAFAAAFELAPDWTEALRLRARTLLEAERNDEAIAQYQALAEHDPEAAEEAAWFVSLAQQQARYGREAVVAAERAREARRDLDVDTAFQAWEAAHAAAPEWTEAHLEAARAAYDAGRAGRAATLFATLAERLPVDDPLRPEALRGEATAAALAGYGEAVARTTALARLDFDRGEVERAISRLRDLIEERPDALPALALLGRIAFAIGDDALAADAYGRAAELDPTDDDLAFFARQAAARAAAAAPDETDPNANAPAEDFDDE